MSEQPIQTTPPPWTLTGNGYIVLYRFPLEWGKQHAHIPQMMASDYKGGIGAMMLVDYHTSNVGAYRELLFVPGLFGSTRAWTYSITRIFVSTMTSVINGRNNWAIPKELATFDIAPTPNGERITVDYENQPILDAQFANSGWSIPINTAWSPIKPSIVQYPETDDTPLRTQPTGKGRVSRSRLVALTVNPDLAPNVQQLKPIMTIRATDFTLTFPEPEHA